MREYWELIGVQSSDVVTMGKTGSKKVNPTTGKKIWLFGFRASRKIKFTGGDNTTANT